MQNVDSKLTVRSADDICFMCGCIIYELTKYIVALFREMLT